ncbi:MAG: transposase, partial [Armatimonadota bacterium]|nr:transposase [Armatimonadota bacterium]
RRSGRKPRSNGAGRGPHERGPQRTGAAAAHPAWGGQGQAGGRGLRPHRAEAERKRREFEQWCQRHGYGKAAETLGRDWDRMVTFYRYPQEHWRHLRTVNVVESPFAALRLRTDAAKRFKKVERAAAVIWKMLMVAQTRFRRLNAPELLAKVYVGVRYEDGIEAAGKEVAA